MGGCSLSGDEAFSLWDTALACVWFKGLTFMACRPIIQSDCLCTDQRFYSGYAEVSPKLSQRLTQVEHPVRILQ